ncbi:hypothetical protein [Vibrio apostichopi]|uniref:hypothetical protein n=1 Tax=Vibrio apostichopi TaxID=3035453 RepID=UPI0025735D0B|nr:hypothetical protein [Vibrio sp. FE10]
MLALLSSNVSASEIHVDLNNLSNISEVGSNTLSITNEFIGYELDEGQYRYARDVDLNGLDWAFLYGKHQRIGKQNTDLISDVTVLGEFKQIENANSENAFGNRYFWQGGDSTDYNHELAFAGLVKDSGGFSFDVKPNKPGRFVVELYSHNWLSSADVRACIKAQCVTIKNDISFHMTSVKNTVTFETQSADDTVEVFYFRQHRQFDFESEQGYHAIEAIQLREVE